MGSPTQGNRTSPQDTDNRNHDTMERPTKTTHSPPTEVRNNGQDQSHSQSATSRRKPTGLRYQPQPRNKKPANPAILQELYGFSESGLMSPVNSSVGPRLGEGRPQRSYTPTPPVNRTSSLHGSPSIDASHRQTASHTDCLSVSASDFAGSQTDKCSVASLSTLNSHNSRRSYMSRTRDEREVKKISKLVQRKLEAYMNCERREERFDINGKYRTTERMAKYDVAYKLHEQLVMDRINQFRREKAGLVAEEAQAGRISPRLDHSSRRVTLQREAERLTTCANYLFDSLPMERLATIHRYRPHPVEMNLRCPENGNIHNYTRHIGSALHAHDYVQFYLKHGLHCGNPEVSPRFRKMYQMRPDDAYGDESLLISSELSYHNPYHPVTHPVITRDKENKQPTVKHKRKQEEKQVKSNLRSSKSSRRSPRPVHKKEVSFVAGKDESRERNSGVERKRAGATKSASPRRGTSGDKEKKDEEDEEEEEEEESSKSDRQRTNPTQPDTDTDSCSQLDTDTEGGSHARVGRCKDEGGAGSQETSAGRQGEESEQGREDDGDATSLRTYSTVEHAVEKTLHNARSS